MRAIFPRLCLIVGASGLLLQVGCGGCDDDTNPPDANDTDARVFDASPDAEVIDAMTPANRSGQIAVTEVRLLNADAQALGLSGGAVSIEFQDLTTFNPASIAFDNRDALGNGCIVQVFDRGVDPQILPADVVDEGAVTITGAQMTFNTPCAFSTLLGRYACVQDGGALAANTTIANNANGTATIVKAGGDFAPNMVATYAVFPEGFDEGANAAIFTATQAFPVMAQPAANIIVIAIGTAPVAAETVGAAGDATGLYQALAGEAPVPNGAAISDLLDDGTADVSVVHAVGTNVEGFTSDQNAASGEAIDLDDDSDDPSDITLDGSAVTFSCDGANGTCGAMSGAALEIMAVSGKTTDTAPVSGDGTYIMRPPTTKWATWSCAALAGTSLTIPTEAMTAIMGTTPERLEFRIFRMSADIQVNDAPPPNRTNVVIGHGVVGHTTPPP